MTRGPIHVRPATQADLPAVERLCSDKVYLDSMFMTGPQLREFTLGHHRENVAKVEGADDVRVLVACQEDAILGYFILILHTKETITQELQTLIFDFCCPSYDVAAALVEAAREIAQEVQDDYLVIHIQVAAKKEQIWFYRLGFRGELNRVVKRVAAGHKGPRSPQFKARYATPNEHLFIIRVNAEFSAVYRPAGRDTDLQTVKAAFLGAYVALPQGDKDWHFIILEDRQARMPAGYIILVESPIAFSPTPGYYTYDVAVAPEYSGRGLSLFLCGAAETLIGKRGGGFMFGDTSLTNVAAVNGDRNLGFTVDSLRWGLDCRIRA